MRKTLVFLTLVFGAFTAPALAAPVNLYFDSSVSNYATCSLASPCTDLKGTSYYANGVECGSTINLKRGKTWEGSIAEFVAGASTATSCASNPIYVQAYGSGANPILYGAPVTSTGWSASTVKSNITVDASTDTFTFASHGFGTGDEIRFSATGSMPGGLTADTTYYIRGTGSNGGDPAPTGSFKVSATRYGAAIDITSNGSGVQFYTPGVYVQSAAQTQTHLKTVSYLDNGVHKGLGWWGGQVSSLQEGTFKRESNTLYVRLEGNLDPSTSSVRIGNFTHYSGTGDRGLLRSTNDETKAIGIRFRDITIIASNGVGYSASGTNTEDLNLEIIASARDSHLFYAELAGSGENASSSWSYRLKTSYGSAYAGGGNAGQPITNYGGAYNGYTHFKSTNGRMAGVDDLDFGANSNAIQTVYLRGYTCNNGTSRTTPSFDAAFYIDGSHDVFGYGIEVCGAGQGHGLANGARLGLHIGSEHPSTKPTYNIWWWNSLIYDNHWAGFGLDNANSSTANLTGIDLRFLTVVAAGTSSTNFDYAFRIVDISSNNDSWAMNHSVIICDNGNVCASMPAGNTFTGNRNVYYRRGGSSTLFSGSATTLASWQTATGEEANSVNPASLPITTDSTVAGVVPDPKLPNGSAAIDIGGPVAVTYPSWLHQEVKDDIGTYGVRGTTRASGVEDDVATSPDAGFHKDYGRFTNTSVTAGTLVQSSNTTLTFNFTIPRFIGEIVHTDYFKITLPSGFTLNSGGTSAASSSTISGTWSACTVNGQVITCERAGDGNSEFYGAYTLSISNVGLPASLGTTGTFSLELFDTDDKKYMEATSIPGINITSAPSSNQTVTPRGCRFGKSSH